jgi:hypothetical protein
MRTKVLHLPKTFLSILHVIVASFAKTVRFRVPHLLSSLQLWCIVRRDLCMLALSLDIRIMYISLSPLYH